MMAKRDANMAKAHQNTDHDDDQDAGKRVETGERWIRETALATEEVPGIDRHHRRELTKKLRGKWSYIDSIHIERKSGRNWVSSGIGLVMPEGRKGVSPEGGAEEVVSLARAYWETYQGRAQIRIAVMGHSQSGSTAKMLFHQLVDFNELDEDGDDLNPVATSERSKREKDVESIAAMDTMRQATNDAMTHWHTAIRKVETMADKVVELADQSSKNWTGMVEVMRLQYQAKKEEREAAVQARDDERSAERFDMFAEHAMGIASRLAEEYLRGKVGSAVVDGTYSQRLRAILETLSDDQRSQARERLGDEPWQILEDAANGVTNEAFTQLMHRAADAMDGDPQQAMMQVFPLLKPEVAQALMILLNEASKA